MGKRQRKAAREGRAHTRPPRGGGDVEALVWQAVAACQRRTPDAAAWTEAAAARGSAAVEVAAPLLRTATTALAGRGWTPADIRHVVTRRLSAEHAGIVVDGAPLTRQAGHAVSQLVQCLALVTALPEIAVQAAVQDPAAVSGLDPKLLERVRALLHKAESTDFPEEAEALTAKAQELIARHAIDALLLDRGDTSAPTNRRVHLDDPYVDAKALLLDRVAAANRCSAVFSPAFGWSDVVGFPGDLDATELLTQSLLAQAAHALALEGSRVDASGRSRTRSFRRSFLVGFGERAGQRLQQATATTVAAAGDRDAGLLPVLARRDERVAAARDELHPNLRLHATSVSNGGGWAAGQAAGEVADLSISRDALSDRQP